MCLSYAMCMSPLQQRIMSSSLLMKDIYYDVKNH